MKNKRISSKFFSPLSVGVQFKGGGGLFKPENMLILCILHKDVCRILEFGLTFFFWLNFLVCFFFVLFVVQNL